MSCPRCAKPVPPGAAFCPSCGLPIGAPVPTGSMRPATGPATRPTPGGPVRTGARPAVPAAPRQDAPRPGAPQHTAPNPFASNPPAGASSVAADFDAQKRRNRWAMIGGGALALLAAIFGLKAAGLLRLGASSPTSAVQVHAQTPPPAIQLHAQATPAPLQKEAVRPVMPADVEAWLKHLEKCEQMKVTISGDQMAEAMVLMQKMQALGAGMGLMDPYDQSKEGEEDKDPGAYAKGKVMDFRPRWDQLLQFFNSVPPPEECKPLAADFNRALGEVPGMMGDIGDVLNDVTTDPSAALQKANKIKGGSYGDIDRYFARADQKLSDICAKYEKNKWFNIKADVQGGSPLSMFGNLGGQSGGGLPGMSG